MTHIRITIDDVVEFDGSVTEWSRTPPDKFKDQIRPGATPRPHMKAILVTVGDAILRGQSMRITARTSLEPTGADGWSMTVAER